MKQKEQRKFFSLKNDYAFTQVMKKERVLQGFLSAVLGVTVEDILSVEVKDRYLDRNSAEEKYGILDIRAKISNIGDFDIEMQLNEYAYWKNRSIFYTSKMYVEDILSGAGYEQCSKVISISLLGFNLCKNTNYFHSSFHLREDVRGDLYTDILEFHVIELKKLSAYTPTERDANLYKWAQLINAESEEEYNMIEKDPYIEEALKEVERLSRDPDHVKEYEWRDRCLRDYISFKNAAIKEGLEEGLEQGIEQGIAKGKLTKLVYIVNKKLKKNMTVCEIADILEEDVATIEKIVSKIAANPTWTCGKIADELERV